NSLSPPTRYSRAIPTKLPGKTRLLKAASYSAHCASLLIRSLSTQQLCLKLSLNESDVKGNCNAELESPFALSILPNGMHGHRFVGHSCCRRRATSQAQNPHHHGICADCAHAIPTAN